MENGHKFFNNKNCKYFPCHPISDKDELNCLFCYCPLYHLGDKCGGEFTILKMHEIKNCADCSFPHLPENYGLLVKKLKEQVQKRQ